MIISGVVMQREAYDVDEEERDDPSDWEKNDSRPLFLTHCRYVEKTFIEMLLG